MDTMPQSAVPANDRTSAPPLPANAPEPSRRGLWIALILTIVALFGGLGYLAFRSAPPVGTPSPSSSASAGEKTVLTYATHWDQFQAEGIMENGKIKYRGLNQYLQEYEALHPDIQIKTVFLEFSDYQAGIKVLNDAGAPPDIYSIYSTWGVSMAHGGLLATPPADIQQDVKDHYLSTAGVTIDGKIWGIPTELDDYLLVYNKRMFKDAGIVDAQGNALPPATWDEAVNDAVKLARHDAQGHITRYGFAFQPDIDDFITDPFLSVLFTNGGHYLSDDLTKCRLNEPAGVQALDKFLALFRRGATDPNGNLWDISKGTVAMAIMAPWVEQDLRDSLGDAFDSTIGVAPIPQLKQRSTLQYSWFIGVMQGSKHQKEAWDFLRWFTEEVQPSTGTTRLSDLLAQNIGAIPSRKADIAGEQAFVGGSSFRKPFVDALPFSVPEPNVQNAADIKTALRNQIQTAWVGKKTAQQALDDACSAIDMLLVR